MLFLITAPILSSKSIEITKKQTENIQKNSIEIQSLDSKVQEIINKINETMLRSLMEELLLIGPRMTSTYGYEKAAEYIINKFNKAGLETRTQPWEAWGNLWHPRYFKADNIEATQNGINENCDDVIIFNAHYDTVRDTPGANDDGSGVVAVLAAAQILSQYQFNKTIKYVTFSGEEIGLRGSRAYVKEQYDKETDILIEFNADMIAKSEGKKMRISKTEDANWAVDILREISNETGMDFNITTYDVNRGVSGGSDYAEFARLGYETLAFWQGGGDPDMHKPGDTIEKINFSYFVNYTKHIVGAIACIADLKLEEPRIKIVNPKREKIFLEDIIIGSLDNYKTIVFDKTLVTADVEEGLYPVQNVKFYYDGKLAYTDDKAPYQWWLNKTSIFKNHVIKAVVNDTNSNTAEDEITIMYTNIFKNDRN